MKNPLKVKFCNIIEHQRTGKKKRTRRQLIDATRANKSGLVCACRTSQRIPRRKTVTLSQNEIILWRQTWAFLSNPHTELLIIPICCSPSHCLSLSQALINSAYLTCAFHLWSYFMCRAVISLSSLCLWQENHFHTRWTWSVTHHFFWGLLAACQRRLIGVVWSLSWIIWFVS